MRLPDELVDAGDELLVFDCLDSTMDEARRLSAERRASRLWIVARQQTAGRGRQGRAWSSPAGNLSMTLLLPAPCAINHQPKLGFAAGVALANATSCFINPSSVALKWPNDLLVNGAKASGLLLEGLSGGAAIAIGIGVNVTSHPDDTPYPATHLGLHAPGLTAEALFAALAEALTSQLDEFADARGFPLIRARWLAHAAHLGQSIRVRLPDRDVNGCFQDIDADGRLLLQTADALLPIDAGDVFPLDN